MVRYILGRILQAVLVMVVAYTVAFLILYGLGGDPIKSMYSGGDAGVVSDTELDQIRHQFGLDQPLIVQFFTRFGAALTGNFGVSFKNGQSVNDLIATALPYTLQLVGLALLFAIVLGAGIALAATASRRNWLRQGLLALPSLGVSMPTFWIGLILMQVFAFEFKWFPPLGVKGFGSLVLPAITMALPGAAQIAQVLAKSIFTAQGEAYITTARAIGLRPSVIHLRDTLRNALIPSLTVLGIMIANLFGATIVVENVFARQGLGQIVGTSVLNHDIPVVLAVVVLGALIFALATLVIDLLYLVVDPRLRPARRVK